MIPKRTYSGASSTGMTPTTGRVLYQRHD
jgi:hypothetical protein